MVEKCVLLSPVLGHTSPQPSPSMWEGWFLVSRPRPGSTGGCGHKVGSSAASHQAEGSQLMVAAERGCQQTPRSPGMAASIVTVRVARQHLRYKTRGAFILIILL